jgi:hypothetical protein
VQQQSAGSAFLPQQRLIAHAKARLITSRSLHHLLPTHFLSPIYSSLNLFLLLLILISIFFFFFRFSTEPSQPSLTPAALLVSGYSLVYFHPFIIQLSTFIRPPPPTKRRERKKE